MPKFERSRLNKVFILLKYDRSILSLKTTNKALWRGYNMLQLIGLLVFLLFFVTVLFLLVQLAVKLDENAAEESANINGVKVETGDNYRNVVIRRCSNNDHEVVIVASLTKRKVTDIMLALCPAFRVDNDHPLKITHFKDFKVTAGKVIAENFPVLQGTWHERVSLSDKQNQTILYTCCPLSNDQLGRLIHLFPGCKWTKYTDLKITLTSPNE
jgi:hypothetical protein